MKLKALIIISLFNLPCVTSAQNNEWIFFSCTKLINSIATSGDNIWLGTYAGPICFNKSTSKTRRFYTCNCKIPTNRISDVVTDINGNIYYATLNELIKFDGSNWLTIDAVNLGLQSNYISCIRIDPFGNIWLGTYWGGLIKYDGINAENYYLEDYICDFDFDKNGDVWIAASHGVYVLRDGIIAEHFTAENSGLPLAPWPQILDVETDAQGNKWFASSAGLIYYDGSNWTAYNTSNSGLPNNWVNCITIDSHGNVWVGTYGGVGKLTQDKWAVYNSANGVPSVIQKILVENDTLQWFATDDGLTKFDSYLGKTYDFSKADFNYGWIQSISIDQNNVKWFASDNALAKYDGSDWYTYKPGLEYLEYPNIKTILTDNVNVWIGTEYDGLLKFDGINWTKYNDANSPMPSNRVNSLALFNNSIWIGTDNGLAKYDGENWNIYNSSNSTLPSNIISQIALKNGEVWLASPGLIINFIDENQCFVYDTLEVGLVPSGNSFSVNGIVFDKNNNKWFATNLGLIMFNDTVWKTMIPNFDISLLCIDQNDILWMTSTYSDIYKYDIISGLDSIDTFMDTRITSIYPDKKNNIWVGSGTRTVGVYNESGVDMDIIGNVLDFAGDSIKGGQAYLYNITNLIGGYDTVAVTDIIKGTYTFKHIGDCGYTIFTDPEIDYTYLLPSYLGDTILWMGSDTLNVHASTNAKTITLYEQPPQSSGKTTIIGDVESLLNAAGKKNGTKKRDPIDNAGVAVIKKNKNTKGDLANLVAYTRTDPDGRFKFDNFETGDKAFSDYYIFIDYPGIPMDTLNQVNKLQQMVPGDTIILHASVNPDKINITSNVITKIDDISDHSGNLKIYPNPLKVSATFEFPNDSHESYEFKLLNMSGIILKTINNITENNFVLMREDLDTGFYIFELRGDKKYSGKLLVE